MRPGGTRLAEAGAPRATIATALAKDANSFGLIRLVLACAVIASHSWTLGGGGHEPLFDLSGGVSLGFVSVAAFFGLSGVLVGLSAETSTPGEYLRKRASRILPGFWACLFVTACVLAPAIALVRGLDLRGALLSPTDGSMRTYVALQS